MMASVSGRRRVISVPWPGWVAMSIVPRRPSIVRLTTSMPTPRPDSAVTSLRGREAGLEDQLIQLGVGQRWRPAAIRPFSSALARMRLASRPRPSSLTLISTSAPAWRADQADAARRRLAGRDAASGIFEAVIGGVADQVDQRIGEPLDHRLVEFGLLAGGRQFDLLAEIARQVVDQAAEAAEQRADRHHAHAHRGVAQRRGQPFDLLGDALGAGRRRAASWFSRAWAITSSPTRSISSSSRSAGTRMVAGLLAAGALGRVSGAAPACSACVGAEARRLRAGATGAAARRRAAPAAAASAGVAASTASTFSSMSSSTNMNTSSMALRGCAMVEDDVPSQIARVGIHLVERRHAVAVGPSPGNRRERASSSSSSSGLVPLTSTSLWKRKPSRQVVAQRRLAGRLGRARRRRLELARRARAPATICADRRGCRRR